MGKAVRLGIVALLLVLAIASTGCAPQQATIPPAFAATAPPNICPLPDAPPQAIASKPGYLQYVVTVVKDSGEAVQGLQQSDFEVSAEGKDVPIEYFRDNKDTMPASIVIIVDSSGSMKKKFAATDKSKVQSVSAGIRNASANLNTCDELALTVFAYKFSLATTNAKAIVAVPLTTNREDVLNRSDSITPWGQTPLYDSIELAERQLELAHYPNRQIVVITDGIDDASVIQKEPLLQEAARANVPIDILAGCGKMASFRTRRI